jgi:prepilin-type N-terminal cleavage/methylation domain-containing protein
MKCFKTNQAGYTIIELVIVVVILAILAGVAVTSLTESVEVSRTLTTREKLDRIAWAIAGNPELVSSGNRTDFGYIGDIGSLPPSLDALVTNPGLGTWHGPYVRDDFATGAGNSTFKRDAWAKDFTYSGGVTIAATGGNLNLTRTIAKTTAELLSNEVTIAVTDIDYSPPGVAHVDSVSVSLTYPNGTGGFATVSKNPYVDGRVTFSGVPIGIHTLAVAFSPTNDTLTRKITVLPGGDYYAELAHFSDLWTGSGDSGEVVTDGLLAYYKFDDGSGSTAEDWTGNGNTGSLTNMSSAWTTGKIGGCLQFDGSNDLVETTDAATRMQISGDYSTSVWIKPDASQKIWAGIYSRTDPTGATNHWNLQFDNSSNRNLIIYHGSSQWQIGARLADVAGDWHHIGVVRTGTTMTIYLDGVVIRTATWSNGAVSGNGHLNIGGDRTGTSSYVFKGLIDDLRIYDRAITPAEMQTLYALGS